jgi:hypothetical protein
MKKVNRHLPDVAQGTADRGTESIERLFNAYGVKRASDLPEEGKVRLYRQMQQYFSTEMPHGVEARPPTPWWAAVVARVRSFFVGE